MGFFDKVKVQAEKAKVQAQDFKGKVGEKVEEVQGKRKADDLLDDLGRFWYAEKTGRPLPGADAEVQRIVQELKALEADGVPILPGPPADGAPPPAPEAAPAPAAAAAPAPAPEAPAPEPAAPEPPA